MGSIRLSVYVTAQAIMQFGIDPHERARMVREIRDLGAGRVFIDVWRGSRLVEHDLLRAVRDAFLDAGFQVGTGIFTVSGRDEALEGTPDWEADATIGSNSRWGSDICYCNPRSKEVLREAMRSAAALFDEFLIDDALCTQCTCARCRAARGDRTWSQFRRDLMLEVSRDVIVGTCREVNPRIRMIMKFPQWYDRLHLFGYDTSREPAVFDATWIGTETRDPDTPQYGYAPQYEACFNVRWHKAASPKLEGAWFDYFDCDPTVFVEQAYQSVLGGARNLTVFSYGEALFRGNGYHLGALKAALPRLETLAGRLDGQEPTGVVAVRPHNADSADDGYVFDGLGMIGFPLVPRVNWPAETPTALLLTDHVAGDPSLAAQVAKVVNAGGTVFMTASALTRRDDDDELRALAGYAGDGWAQTSLWTTEEFSAAGQVVRSAEPVMLRFDLHPTTAEVLAHVGGPVHNRTEWVPLVTRQMHPSGGSVVVLNVCGAAPRDYRMDETLNVPLVLQMQLYPEAIVNVIQREIGRATGQGFLAPPKVACYPFSGGDVAIQNFTDHEVVAVPAGRPLPPDAKELLGLASFVERDGTRGVRLPPRTIALVGR